MKALLITIVVLLAVAVAGEGAFIATSTPRPGAELQPTAAERTITVVSEGSVKAKPDVAYLSAGVETRAPTAREAMDQNAAVMVRITQALKDLGVKDEELQTQGLNLYPMPSPDGTVGQAPSYVANNGLRITIGNVDQAGEMLDAAIQAGANSSNGIQFGVKDDSQLQRQALAEAAAQARVRAQAMAASFGGQVGDLVSLTETSASSGYPKPIGMGGGGAAPVQPGELDVSAQVQAVYSLAPAA